MGAGVPLTAGVFSPCVTQDSASTSASDRWRGSDRLTMKLFLLLTELNGIGRWDSILGFVVLADLLVTRLGVDWWG